MKRRVCKDRQYVFEEDSGRREVWELAEGRTESYLKTGEFGGAGGMGGGLSGVLGGGGIWLISRRMFRSRKGHDEERKREGREERGGRKGEEEERWKDGGGIIYDICGLSSEQGKKIQKTRRVTKIIVRLFSRLKFLLQGIRDR